MKIEKLSLLTSVALLAVACGGPDLTTLNDQAHAQCFIANSVRTEVRVEGTGQA